MQKPQIVLQGVYRIEVVLRHRIQAARGRPDRIEPRHVNEVKALRARCDEPASRGHMHAPYNGETGRKLRRRMVLNKTWSILIGRMMEP